MLLATVYLLFSICASALTGDETKAIHERLGKVSEQNRALRSELESQKELYNTLMDEYRGVVTLNRNKKQACRADSNTVVFHARQNEYLNPIGQNQIIVYDSLVTNVGGAYDQYNGLFKAPIDGLYQFIATTWSTHGHFLQYEIVKNNVDICYGRASSTNQSMGICAAVVELSRGDKIWVRHQGNNGDYANGKYYPSFAGHLIM